jgi:hypothetical protein
MSNHGVGRHGAGARMLLATIGCIAMLLAPWSANASPQFEDLRLTQDGLLISSRDRLAICAQGIDGVTLDPDDVQVRIGATLVMLSKDPMWTAAGFDKALPLVEAGCPELAVILRPGVQAERNRRRIPGSLLTDTPSKFLVFVFVASPPLIERTFLGDPPYFRIEIEQLACVGGPGASPCVAVTHGLYLNPEEFQDPRALADALGHAIGLPCAPCKVPPSPGGPQAKPIGPIVRDPAP